MFRLKTYSYISKKKYYFSNVIVTTENLKKTVRKERKKAEENKNFTENKEKIENTDNTSDKNLKEIMIKNFPISMLKNFLEEHGEVLLSSYIMSPKKAKEYVGERTYINPYERKEDILFEGEEIKYPDGSIDAIYE